MPRTLHKTLVDYLVIAISPALIMMLVGSLVFFLIEVFYRGSFQGRLEYIFAMFVIGAVLIGRISIEEGRERAALFALPLGIVTLVAVTRFVAFEGGLAPLSFLINCGLVALVWWSADKLTWDCTLIDEREEDSGEGLLEAVGLDRPGRSALEAEINPAPPEPEETTGRDQPPPGWWERFVERRRRPHAPGVWVVYFSLAALPLFGVGQLLIPAGNLPARQSAFQLLCIYTASGLGLLLSTSFLGLRRYLRQRRQEMPLAMAGVWLVIGGLLIAGVMLVAMLLPRPNAEYAISDLPFHVGSPDQKSSAYGTGRDGVDEDEPWARGEQRDGEKRDGEQRDGKQSGDASSNQPDKTPSGEQKGASKEEKGATGEEKRGAGEEKEKGPSRDEQGPPKKDGEGARSQPGGRAKPGQKSPQSDDRPPDGKKVNFGEPAKPGQGSENKPSDRSAARKEPSGNARPQPPPDGQRPGGNSPPPRVLPRFRIPTNLPAMLVALFKWLFYAAVAALAVFLIWKNRKELPAAIANLMHELMDLWHRLFGGRSRREEATADATTAQGPPPKRFADFVDPFAAGTLGRYAPEELVRYSFEALEAWARDHGHPRRSEQTPHEFVRSLSAQVSSLADDAPRLADLYCQAAYSTRALPAAAAASLWRLWQTLSKEADAALSLS